MANVSELLDRFVQLFNASQFDEGEKDFAPEGDAEEIGTGRRFTPQEGAANSRASKQAFPDAQGTITHKMMDGKNGAAEIVWRGTNHGSLMGQPPTGKSVNVRAILDLETNGSAITRASHYIDVAGMMAQLGVASNATAGGR
jgi:predicted ester cyclase